MSKNIDSKIVRDAATLQMGEISVAEFCVLMTGVTNFVDCFCDYINAHAGEQTAGIAISMVSERVLGFIMAEKKLRNIVSENIESIMASIAAPVEPMRSDSLTDLIKEIMNRRSTKETNRS